MRTDGIAALMASHAIVPISAILMPPFVQHAPDHAADAEHLLDLVA